MPENQTPITISGEIVRVGTDPDEGYPRIIVKTTREALTGFSFLYDDCEVTIGESLTAENTHLLTRLSEVEAQNTSLAIEAHQMLAAEQSKGRLLEIERERIIQTLDTCPWPSDVWLMTMADYAAAVPDEALRTAIGGMLMRAGWEAARNAVKAAITEAL